MNRVPAGSRLREGCASWHPLIHTTDYTGVLAGRSDPSGQERSSGLLGSLGRAGLGGLRDQRREVVADDREHDLVLVLALDQGEVEHDGLVELGLARDRPVLPQGQLLAERAGHPEPQHRLDDRAVGGRRGVLEAQLRPLVGVGAVHVLDRQLVLLEDPEDRLDLLAVGQHDPAPGVEDRERLPQVVPDDPLGAVGPEPLGELGEGRLELLGDRVGRHAQCHVLLPH